MLQHGIPTAFLNSAIFPPFQARFTLNRKQLSYALSFGTRMVTDCRLWEKWVLAPLEKSSPVLLVPHAHRFGNPEFPPMALGPIPVPHGCDEKRSMYAARTQACICFCNESTDIPVAGVYWGAALKCGKRAS